MTDLAIRDASQGQETVREFLQWMNANYANKGHFFNDSAGVREAAEAVSHADLHAFFTKYVAGTEEIPWDDFFRSVGLRAVAIPNAVPDAGFIASRNFDGPMADADGAPGNDARQAGPQEGGTCPEVPG